MIYISSYTLVHETNIFESISELAGRFLRSMLARRKEEKRKKKRNETNRGIKWSDEE